MSMRWNSTGHCSFKGSLTRDSASSFFFTQFPQGPWAYHQGKFEILQKFAKIFVSKDWSSASMTQAMNTTLRISLWIFVEIRKGSNEILRNPVETELWYKKTWSRESRVRFPLNVLYQALDMSTQAAASIVISLSNSQARPSCRSFSSEDSLLTTIKGQTVRLLIWKSLFFLLTFKLVLYFSEPFWFGHL